MAKILYVIKGLGLGGAERHVVDLARYFHKRGDSVSVMYMVASEDDFVPVLNGAGIPVLCTGLDKSKACAVWKHTYTLRELSPDIVHSHLPVPNVMSRVLRGRGNFRLISTYHNELDRLNFVSRTLERATYRFSDRNISCSGKVAQTLGWPSVVINNGIDVSAYAAGQPNFLRHKLGLGGNSTIFLNIANYWPKKNQTLLIQAFHEFCTGLDRWSRDDRDPHLVILGSKGDQLGSLQSLVKELGMQDRIHLMTSHSNVEDFYAGSDVFCMTSVFEGLPLSLLEAMNFSLPCLVSYAGEMSEVVRDGIDGFVCSANDRSAFARSMNILFHDCAARRNMGFSARDRCRTSYSFSAMTNKLSQVYFE